jgi:hypothetical protein
MLHTVAYCQLFTFSLRASSHSGEDDQDSIEESGHGEYQDDENTVSGSFEEDPNHSPHDPDEDDDIDSLLAGLGEPVHARGKSARVMDEDDLDQFLVDLALPKVSPQRLILLIFRQIL